MLRSTPSRRHRAAQALVLALALLVGGCQEPRGDADVVAPPAGTEVADGPDVPPLHPATDHLDETIVTISTADGSEVRVDAKVAATDEQRRRGLMEVEELPAGVGMLFVFAEDRTGGFWMRDTLVPLDIAFIEDDGTIGTIEAMDPCPPEERDDCPVWTPPHPYRLALEVPQGWFADLGVAVGDEVTWTHPMPAP